MAVSSANSSNYLKPSLLDRLTIPKASDYQTGARLPAAGTRGAVSMREQEYCDTVLRDLEWLFNAISPIEMAGAEMRRRYPRAASSILGYGLRGVLGRVIEDSGEIERAIAEAFAWFEPRLVVEDMRLSVSPEGHLLVLEVKGILATEQARREIVIRTDLETLDTQLRTPGHG